MAGTQQAQICHAIVCTILPEECLQASQPPPRLILTTGSRNSSRSRVSETISMTLIVLSLSRTVAILPSSTLLSSSTASTSDPLPPQAARAVPSGDQHSPSKEPEAGRT
eukprot:GHUV01056810.1.p1 GENE.GHUV01056810.1~~GHUV01056810.1.p1  ORF type:complete len:109 (+),score=11.31 GHUV01056810.1:214-540(+)